MSRNDIPAGARNDLEWQCAAQRETIGRLASKLIGIRRLLEHEQKEGKLSPRWATVIAETRELGREAQEAWHQHRGAKLIERTMRRADLAENRAYAADSKVVGLQIALAEATSRIAALRAELDARRTAHVLTIPIAVAAKVGVFRLLKEAGYEVVDPPESTDA